MVEAMSDAALTKVRTVPEGRDLTLDLVRVACVVLVVFVYILFTGVLAAAALIGALLAMLLAGAYRPAVSVRGGARSGTAR